MVGRKKKRTYEYLGIPKPESRQTITPEGEFGYETYAPAPYRGVAGEAVSGGLREMGHKVGWSATQAAKGIAKGAGYLAGQIYKGDPYGKDIKVSSTPWTAIGKAPTVAPAVAPAPVAEPWMRETTTGAPLTAREMVPSRTPSGGYLGLPAGTPAIRWGESREQLTPAVRADFAARKTRQALATADAGQLAEFRRKAKIRMAGGSEEARARTEEAYQQRKTAQSEAAAQREFELKKAGIAAGAEVPQEKVANIRREMQEDATAGGQITNMWNKMVSMEKSTGIVNQFTGEPERVPYSAQEQADLWEQAKTTVTGTPAPGATPEGRQLMNKADWIASFTEKQGRPPSSSETARSQGKYWIEV